MVAYILINLLRPILQRLPVRVSYALAAVVGNLTFAVWVVFAREKAEYVIDNMRRVLGQDTDPRVVKAMARRSLQNYCKYLADFLRFPRLGGTEIEQMVRFTGWEYFDRALQAGRGVIFIGMHMGNFDLGGAALALRNYPVNVIAETFQPERLNRLVQTSRAEKGIRVIPLEQSARRVLSALRRNEMLALLIDRPSPDGVPVTFFGYRTSVPGGAALLALKTGAAVIPACVVRQPDNSYLGIVDKEIEFQPIGNLTQDVQDLTQKIVSSLESWIQRYPDQWYMFRPMWGENTCST
ncbi:MAG: hypothetical protein EPO21_23325 [Chloroflexota bacterium]|nr:MAG: hypothetical protein EPO21_23325 [Chloroflexota bacterium]